MCLTGLGHDGNSAPASQVPALRTIMPSCADLVCGGRGSPARLHGNDLVGRVNDEPQVLMLYISHTETEQTDLTVRTHTYMHIDPDHWAT